MIEDGTRRCSQVSSKRVKHSSPNSWKQKSGGNEQEELSAKNIVGKVKKTEQGKPKGS